MVIFLMLFKCIPLTANSRLGWENHVKVTGTADVISESVVFEGADMNSHTPDDF